MGEHSWVDKVCSTFPSGQIINLGLFTDRSRAHIFMKLFGSAWIGGCKLKEIECARITNWILDLDRALEFLLQKDEITIDELKDMLDEYYLESE